MDKIIHLWEHVFLIWNRMWHYNLQASGLPAGFSSQCLSFLIAARLSVTVTFHTALQWSSTSPPSVTAK